MYARTFQFRLDTETAQTLSALAAYTKRSQADTLRLLINAAKNLPHFKDNPKLLDLGGKHEGEYVH